MVKSEPIPFAVGDVVKLKKAHPCGGFDWTVVRLGADIGIKCQICARRVLLPRRDLERRMKTFVARAAVQDISPTPDRSISPAKTETGIST